MDNEHYNNIYQYLLYKQTPEHFTQQQKQQLFKQTKNYVIENNLLYKKDRKHSEKLYRVIQKEELPAILYMMHNDPTSEHFATDATFNKIKTRYYWPQYYEDIKQYVESCNACQQWERSKKNNLLHPIPVHSPFYQVGIDFVGPLPRTQRGKKFIMQCFHKLRDTPIFLLGNSGYQKTCD